MGPLAIREVPISEFLTVCKRAQGPVCDSSPIFSMHSARPRAHFIFSTRDSAVMGGGRVQSPSGSSALVGLNLRPYRKAGRLEDWLLPVPDRSSKPPRLVEPVLKRAIEAQSVFQPLPGHVCTQLLCLSPGGSRILSSIRRNFANFAPNGLEALSDLPGHCDHHEN